MSRTKILLGILASGLLAFSGASALADDKDQGPGKMKDKIKDKEQRKENKENKEGKENKGKKTERPAVGSIAPAFKLKDTEGKEVALEELTAGKNYVVVEWFNPDCPFVKKHHELSKTMNDMVKKYDGKNVKFVAVNSGATGKQGAGLERNKKAKADYNIAYPILMDENGDVGRLYGAKRTPEMYVVSPDGKLIYAGAMDDNTDAKELGKTNYVIKALDEALAGKPVTMAETKAYGCSVKYAD